MIPKTSTYVKSFDEQTKWKIYFLTEDNDKSVLILKKNSKKEFDTELVYNKSFLTTKIKSYGDEFTDFYDK